MIAFLGFTDLVDIAVAIALGASVQPLTKITPNVNSVVMTKGGLFMSSLKKELSVTVIFHQHSFCFCKFFKYE